MVRVNKGSYFIDGGKKHIRLQTASGDVTIV
jgi:hypothetical protein